MATNKKAETIEKQKEQFAEELFEKYVKNTIRTLGSTEFYEYFMGAMAQGQNEIQFSNRRMEKIVDTEWIDAIENVLTGFQNIIERPRSVIREDELIVNVANARKTGSDVVRHLATHASLVEDFNEDTGNVRPNKVMQKYREDSIGQVYENRVVFTTLELAYQFVKIRHDALFEVMGEEFGAKLKFKTDMESTTEKVHMDLFLHINDKENIIDTDDKNREVFNRISRLYRILSNDMNSHFAKHMSKYPRIRGNVTKTNVLKKNKDYRLIIELLDYLKGYNNVGYTIKVIEQNPKVDEKFEQDIFRNTMFQYLLLKSHLEKDKDRRLPAPVKEKKRTLKPKFIKEIIEELTEDYDLPEVEIRKVLIEELTKEQLMRQESEERHRLVEEQAQRKKAEKERVRLEREAEKERIRLEKEAEKERIRREKEAEEQRLYIERMEQEQEDRRRVYIFNKDIKRFFNNFDERLYERSLNIKNEKLAITDFEDAAYILEETERIKKEQAVIRRQRKRQELEHLHQLEMEEKKRAIEQEQAQKEQERIEREKKDLSAISVFVNEVALFNKYIDERMLLREQQALEQKQIFEDLNKEKQRRIESKNIVNKRRWRI